MLTAETITVDFENRRVLIGKENGTVQVIHAESGAIEVLDTMEAGEVHVGLTSTAAKEEAMEEARVWLEEHDAWRSRHDAFLASLVENPGFAGESRRTKNV